MTSISYHVCNIYYSTIYHLCITYLFVCKSVNCNIWASYRIIWVSYQALPKGEWQWFIVYFLFSFVSFCFSCFALHCFSILFSSILILALPFLLFCAVQFYSPSIFLPFDSQLHFLPHIISPSPNHLRFLLSYFLYSLTHYLKIIYAYFNFFRPLISSIWSLFDLFCLMHLSF